MGCELICMGIIAQHFLRVNNFIFNKYLKKFHKTGKGADKD